MHSQFLLSYNQDIYYLGKMCLEGQNTLWGDQDYYHNILFFRSSMFELQHVIIMKDFQNVFAYMVNQNLNKSNSKKITFLNLIWCDVRVYLCQENIGHNILKNAYTFKKWLKWFLVFMKFVIFIQHCDSIWLEKAC